MRANDRGTGMMRDICASPLNTPFVRSYPFQVVCLKVEKARRIGAHFLWLSILMTLHFDLLIFSIRPMVTNSRYEQTFFWSQPHRSDNATALFNPMFYAPPCPD